RREAASLPCALIVYEEKCTLRVPPRRTAKAAPKNVLLHGRPGLARTVQKILIRIKHIVAEKLVHVAVETFGPGLEDSVHVPAAIASLAGVVERSLHLELLNHVRIGERHIGALRHIVVGSTDALDQQIVVVLALAVDDNANVAAPQLRRSIELALGARGERQQLLEV